MRVRTGFVSNSSSSSFIMLGVKLTAAQNKKAAALYEAKDYEEPYIGLQYLEEESLLGVMVDVDEGGIRRVKFDEKVVSRRLEKALGVPVAPCLFVGNRLS